MSTKLKNNFFERNPTMTITITIMLVIIAIDLASANLYKLILGYNIFDKEDKEIDQLRSIETTYRIRSNIYSHDLKNNFFTNRTIYGNRIYSISTDSLGFKSKNVQNTPLFSNKYRVLFIGDSFTEGIGLEYQYTFVGIIADKLPDKNMEVLNAAVTSYSPIIYWRKIKYLLEDVGLKFDEVVVFIDISDIEDEAKFYKLSESNTVMSKEQKKESTEAKTNNTIKDIIKNQTILLYFVIDKINSFTSTPLTQIRTQEDMKYRINLRRGRWTIDNKLFKDYGETGLNNAAHFMELLFELLKKHDIKLTIAVYPWPDQIINNDLNSIQVTYWRDWAQKRNISFLNYFPCFIKSDNTKTVNKLTIETFFFPGDMHLNEKGNKLIADNFLSYYKDNFRGDIEFCSPNSTR